MPDEILPPSDATPIHARQPDEPPNHYEWFYAYLLIGPSRSLVAAYNLFRQKAQKSTNKPTKNYLQASGAWKVVFEKRNWKVRAEAWDAERRAEVEAQEILRRREWMDSFGKRLEDKAEVVLNEAERMQQIKNKIFAHPLHEQNGVHGGQPFVILPSRWTLDTGVRLSLAETKSYEVALKLYIELDNLRAREATRQESAISDAMMASAIHALQTVQGDGEILTPTQQRERGNALLDALEASLLSKAQRGVAGADGRLLRVAQRRSALNGLDQPFDPSREEKPKKRRDLSKFKQAELDLMEEMFFEEEAD